MKKILSMLIVLCMLFTTLMSTMSLEVNAAFLKTDNTITYTFDTSPTTGFDVGEWYVTFDGLNTVKLGTTAVANEETTAGMIRKDIILEEGSLTGGDAETTYGTINLRAEVFDGIFVSSTSGSQYLSNDVGYSQGDCGIEYYSSSALDTEIGYGTANVAKWTYYAYSELPDGENITFSYVRQASENTYLTVPASALYSKNGIPHKIDVLLYYNGTEATPLQTGLAAKSDFYIEVFIDGVSYGRAENYKKFGTNNANRYNFVSANIDIGSADENGTISWKETKLHIWAPRRASYNDETYNKINNGTWATIHTREDISNGLFQAVDFENDTAGANKTGFVTGVDTELASAVEAAYTAQLGSDRVIYVDESYYNNPASIWDEGDTSNVSLVSKASLIDADNIEDVTAYTIGDAVPGDFSNYVVAVNGVYALVEQPDITYDKETKKVTLSNASIPAGTTSLQIIVSAYNEAGKLEKIKVSESYTDFTADITYTIADDSFPANADKYKLFVFDSITSSIPLLEALVID